MSWVQAERAALAEAFLEAGPDAPTLCTGWSSRYLLAHVVQRENGPAAMIVDQLSHRPPGAEPRLSRLADTARTQAGFEELVRRFADGPARLSPMSWAGETLNLVEFLVHREDVLRAADERPTPTTVPPEQGRKVFGQLRLMAGLTYRKAPVGVTLVSGSDRLAVKKGRGPVELHAAPVELALYVTGRRSVADVELVGPAADVEAFESWIASQ